MSLIIGSYSCEHIDAKHYLQNSHTDQHTSVTYKSSGTESFLLQHHNNFEHTLSAFHIPVNCCGGTPFNISVKLCPFSDHTCIQNRTVMQKRAGKGMSLDPSSADCFYVVPFPVNGAPNGSLSSSARNLFFASILSTLKGGFAITKSHFPVNFGVCGLV